MATSGCKVDLKGERLTFDVNVEFVLFKNHNIPSPSALDEDMDFHDIGSFDDWWHIDPFVFNCVTTEGLGLDYATVEFNMPAPPSIVEDETYATNEVSMSDYCRFAQVVQSMPQIDDIEHDFDFGVKLRSGLFDGAKYKFITCTD